MINKFIEAIPKGVAFLLCSKIAEMRVLLLFPILFTLLSACTPGLKPKLGPPAITTYQKFHNVEFQASESPFRFYESNQNDYWGNKIQLPPNFYNVIEKLPLNEFLEKTKTIGFLIIRNDSILYEFISSEFAKSKTFTSFSIAKSFLSILVGIAIDQGYLPSTEEPVLKYIPELQGRISDNLKISHLLNHTSGLQTPNINTVYYGANYQKMIMKIKQKNPPPADFKYNNMNSQLIGFILERATKQKLQDFFYQNLWRKLQPESTLSWSLDNKRNNNLKVFCCMNGEMRDFAKFGRLLLNKGKFQEEQIISHQWVERVWSYNTDEKSKLNNNLHWWLGPQKYGYLLAGGLYGQYILIYPDKNVVIVKFSERSIHLPVYWQAIWLRILDQL